MILVSIIYDRQIWMITAKRCRSANRTVSSRVIHYNITWHHARMLANQAIRAFYRATQICYSMANVKTNEHCRDVTFFCLLRVQVCLFTASRITNSDTNETILPVTCKQAVQTRVRGSWPCHGLHYNFTPFYLHHAVHSISPHSSSAADVFCKRFIGSTKCERTV